MSLMRRWARLAALWLLGAAVSTGATADDAAGVPPEASQVGVNLAGGEFGKLPGVANRDYAYPGPRQFDYCQAHGLSIIRLPLKWERVQPQLRSPLDQSELERLDAAVKLAAERGLKVLLDVHNYARYQDRVIGTPEVPYQAFADFWGRLAAHYRDETAIVGLGLMNEPHDTGGRWPAAAQAAIDAIRTVDRRHAIFVCGDGWSGAHAWQKINGALLLRDPAEHLVYEAHQYFDRDNSGTYKQSYDDSDAHPLTGVERLRPFTEWLREHQAQGFIGEFGVPDDDPRWLEVLDRFLAAMKAARIGGTYWAAGGWWGSYPLSVEPRNGQDRPQMEVLNFYAGNRQKPQDAKPPYADAAAKMTRAPRPTAETKLLPVGTEKTVFDLGRRPESYYYSNDGTEYRSEAVEDGGQPARRIVYKHQGPIAWVGAGLYFDGLDCCGYTAFKLAVRAEKAGKLEVKAYHSDKAMYHAVFPIGTQWQELVIRFADLKGGDGSFDSTRKLLKVELQPAPDQAGSSLYLAVLKLAVP